jgi:hypothetical protein
VPLLELRVRTLEELDDRILSLPRAGLPLLRWEGVVACLRRERRRSRSGSRSGHAPPRGPLHTHEVGRVELEHLRAGFLKDLVTVDVEEAVADAKSGPVAEASDGVDDPGEELAAVRADSCGPQTSRIVAEQTVVVGIGVG